MRLQNPLLRLLTLTSLALFLALTILQGLRWLGSEEHYPASRHPWMSQTPWLFARLGPSPCDLNALQALLRLGDPWRIWLDVQETAPHEWRVVCPTQPYSLDSTAFGPKLSDILPQLHDRDIVLNVRGLEASTADSFLPVVTDWAGERANIGIASPSLNLLRELRKRRPEYLFAADFSTWTKLKMYAGFGIASIADLWPDFFIAAAEPEAPNSFSPAAAAEIHRRRKLLLLEWDSADEIPTTWRKDLDGVLTNRPKDFPVDAIFGKMGAK